MKAIEWILIILMAIGGIIWIIGELIIQNFVVALTGAIISIIPFVVLIIIVLVKNNIKF